MARIKKIIIDGDTFIYKAGFSVTEEQPIEFAISNLSNSLSAVLHKGTNIKLYPDTTPIHICLSNITKDNYRYELATSLPYKGQRVDQRKPLYFEELRQYLVDRYEATVSQGQEADDDVGIMACQYDPNEVVIISSDKDLRMIPGIHLDLSSDKEYFYVATDPGILFKMRTGSSWKWFGTGKKWFYCQLLRGDRVDNIAHPWKYKNGEIDVVLNGLSLLYDDKAMYTYTKQVYEEHGSTEDRLIENGQLLWIRRKEEEIWSPPT